MKFGFVVAVTLLAAPLAGVAAKDRPEEGYVYDVVADSVAFNKEQQLVAKRGRPLAVVELSLPSAVQLDGEVPSDVQALIAGGPKSPLAPGTVLWSSARNRNIYCGQLWSRSLGKAGPCFADNNNDGKFDVAIKGGAMAAKPQGIGISNDLMLGIDFDAPIPLTTQIPFHQVSYSSGSKIKANMTWAAVYKSGKAGPATIHVQLHTANLWQGTALFSDTTEIVYGGSPVSAEIYGLRLTVHGFGAKKELIYSLDGRYSARPVGLKFLDRSCGPIIICS